MHTVPTISTQVHPFQQNMAAKDKQKENLEKLTDHVEERQLDADRMAQVSHFVAKRGIGRVHTAFG